MLEKYKNIIGSEQLFLTLHDCTEHRKILKKIKSFRNKLHALYIIITHLIFVLIFAVYPL